MNTDLLKPHLPDHIFAEIPLLEQFEINTELRLSRFLGQCAIESSQFTHFSENLYYTADRMRQVYGRLKNWTDAQLAPYEHNPKAFGNMIYANILGNGNEASGDGFKYCGKGAIQLTGKAQYEELDKSISGVLLNPELLVTTYPLRSAGWYFQKRGLNQLADNSYNNEGVVNQITKRVNSASLGAADRLKWSFFYYDVLTGKK